MQQERRLHYRCQPSPEGKIAIGSDGAPGKYYFSLPVGYQPPQSHDQGRFTGAVWPDYRQNFARVDFQLWQIQNANTVAFHLEMMNGKQRCCQISLTVGFALLDPGQGQVD